VWPIIIGEKELAQSDLYSGSFKDVAKSITINLPPNDDGPAAPVLLFFGGFQVRAAQHVLEAVTATVQQGLLYTSVMQLPEAEAHSAAVAPVAGHDICLGSNRVLAPQPDHTTNTNTLYTHSMITSHITRLH
jgi:hypothetical protein